MDISIAVVDDDARVLASLGTLLAAEGYDVRLFASGTEFIVSGCAANIACLICDIAMPAMDGFEVVRLARETCPRLPVVLVTGCCDASRPSPLVLANCRLFQKPFESQELLAAVAHAIAHPG
jgi:FixJ family two-component response regulator